MNKLTLITDICKIMNVIKSSFTNEIIDCTICRFASPSIHISEKYFDELFKNQGYFEIQETFNLVRRFVTINDINIFCLAKTLINEQQKIAIFVKPIKE